MTEKKPSQETKISIREAQKALANSNASEQAKEEALTDKQKAERERKRLQKNAWNREYRQRRKVRDKTSKQEEKLRRVVKRLPDKARPSVELNWIRVHPAMTRQTRSGEPVVITVDDVINPPQGKAPSQSAVNQLQHWVNHAKEFFKQVITEDRKRLFSADDEEDEKEAAEKDVPKEIKDIDEMLMALEGAVPVDA